jgi:thiopeptide-type bacteriocin biosynthesis protein
MKYIFFKSLILRTPSYSYEDYQDKSYYDLLHDPFFKAALFVANKKFFRELKKRSFDHNLLNQKELNTLKKYFNRACFRPTPFGLFSTIGITDWNDHNNITINSSQVKPHIFIDYSVINEYAFDSNVVARSKDKYKVNGSMYEVFNDYRYVKYSRCSGDKRREFSMAFFEKSHILKCLLQFCESARSIEEIHIFLKSRIPTLQNEIQDFIDILINEQILVEELASTITGKDYLERLIDFYTDDFAAPDNLAALKNCIADLKTITNDSLEKLGTYTDQLGEMLPISKETDELFYVITERLGIKNAVNPTQQQSILDGLICLDKLIPYCPLEQLEKFKGLFSKKFEHKETPLLKALDPEVGIGYEDLESIYNKNELIEGVNFEKENSNLRNINWTDVHSLLFSKWPRLQNNTTVAVLTITDEELKSVELRKKEFDYPPSLSIVFRNVANKIYLEQAGGISAATLLGRFSVCSEAVNSFIKEVAKQEQEINKEVIFAEIAHVCNEHVANINRRDHLRDFEIPVLVGSSLPLDRQIQLSDLTVSIRNGRIVLRSKKYNAEVIPRLSSAFNYNKNDLPVFRFLCDLQYQGIKSNFKLNLSQFFPGLDFYPRVEYKDLILELASWNIAQCNILPIKKAEQSSRYSMFVALAKKINLPRYFSLCRFDNEIVFDQDSIDSINLLLDSIEVTDGIRLTEVLENPQTTGIVKDENGKCYINQFVASLHLDHSIFKDSLCKPNAERKNNVKVNFLPGSEWLYFKIHCHPVSSNRLLSKILLPLLNKLVAQKKIVKWFFIRYEETGYHLRLRIQILTPDIGEVINIFNSSFKRVYEKGIISGFQLDVYNREIERYSAKLIEFVENCFAVSSVFILNSIGSTVKELGDTGIELPMIVVAAEVLLSAFNYTLENKILLFEELYLAFFKEFGERKELKIDLEKKYTSVINDVKVIYKTKDDILPRQLKKYVLEFSQAAALLAAETRKIKYQSVNKLLCDIMHMHLNRIFIENQRRQELVSYYILFRFYKSLYFKEKNQHN